MEQMVNLILLFFIFSFVGWCIEVTLKYFEFHRFINRGFFVGPCLPIYGSGAVLITLSVGLASSYESSLGTTFVISFVVCGIVEYMASYLMEKQYHARWWDYSQKPMNLHGRVWIGNLILFGLGGVIIYELLDPILYRFFDGVPVLLREIVAGVMIAVFATDFVISYLVMKLVKQGVESSQADNTEEINKEVKLLLSNRSIFYRRFAEAYPDVIYKTERISKRLEEVRRETERLRQDAEKRMDQINQRLGQEKQHLAESLETSTAIRNDIIQKQAELIEMLYREESATSQQTELKNEIEDRRAKLQGRSFQGFNTVRANQKQ